MNKLIYEPVKGIKQNDYAVSFCLYKSPNFDTDKHIKPFEKFLNENGQLDYDILLFYGDENDLTPDIINNNKIRLYKVLSEEKHYTRHLWRYLGALEDYKWIWFRGTDTPIIPKREIRLQFAAEYSGCDIVIWSRPNISCLGKFCLNRRIGNNFIDYLRKFEISDRLAVTWDCDEKILSSWVDTGDQKVMLALDGPTLRNPHQEEWAIRRLRHGNHTVIVKDRDDRKIING